LPTRETVKTKGKTPCSFLFARPPEQKAFIIITICVCRSSFCSKKNHTLKAIKSSGASKGIPLLLRSLWL
jgi:hypothetical protein